MEEQAHIFPFYTLPEAKFEKIQGLETEKIILRGIEINKKELDSEVAVFCNGQKLNGKIFYWVPTNDQNNCMNKGLKLIKKGLGFAKNHKFAKH